MSESHETQPASANEARGDEPDVIVVGGGQAGLAIGYFRAFRHQCGQGEPLIPRLSGTFPG
jgi:hypothetical protein